MCESIAICYIVYIGYFDGERDVVGYVFIYFCINWFVIMIRIVFVV